MSGNGIDLTAIYQAVLALDRKIDAVSNDLSGQIGALREQVTWQFTLPNISAASST